MYCTDIMFGSYIPTVLRSDEYFFDIYCSHVYVLRFYLGTAYLAEIENFLMKVKKKKMLKIKN